MHNPNSNYKVTIIIISSNTQQTSEALKWIDTQTIKEQIVVSILENYNNNNFRSAAQALNYGAEKANTDFVVFMHQDIYLWEKTAIERTVEYLASLNEEVILGAAGVCVFDKTLHSDIYGRNKKRFAPLLNGQIQDAISLDECFIAMKKTLWNKLRFDEETCDNWHFYGVDICYNNLLSGGSNIVYPLEICHESDGNPNNRFFRKSLKKVIKKYKGKIDFLLTPVIQIRCSLLGYYKYCLKCFLKKFGIIN